MIGFSLVAEIGWLASSSMGRPSEIVSGFSLVAEIGWLASKIFSGTFETKEEFQSRCRDWVVGEGHLRQSTNGGQLVSVSLPRLGGWRADGLA